MATATKPLPELEPGDYTFLSGGRLVVPSRTSEGVTYVTDAGGGCSCIAGQRGRPCWHQKYRKRLRENAIKSMREAGITAEVIIKTLGDKFPEII